MTCPEPALPSDAAETGATWAESALPGDAAGSGTTKAQPTPPGDAAEAGTTKAQPTPPGDAAETGTTKAQPTPPRDAAETGTTKAQPTPPGDAAEAGTTKAQPTPPGDAAEAGTTKAQPTLPGDAAETGATWAEFALPGDALPAAAAFLRGALDSGADGLFLRAEGRLVVQVRGADHLSAPAPRGPASTVPLAGPVFSGPELGPATRAVLAGATPALLDLPADRAALSAVALDLMAAHLPAVSRPGAPGGPPLSFLSYRSHAEAFVVTSRDPAAARHALDSRYEAVRDAVEPRVASILRDGQVPAGARAWHDVVRAAKPGIAEHFRAGGIQAHTGYAGDHLRERDDFAGSRFHQVAGASADLQDYLGSDPGFLATRLLTSLLYLTLHSIGLSLADRYVLCHVVSRACESVYDVESVAVLSGIASAGLGKDTR